jgi:sodium/potassium-transporting ATPase subunit alpha
VLRAYFFLGAIEAAAAMAGFFFILRRGGWLYGQQLALNDPLYLQATTACLTSIIMMQIVNVFLCRSRHRSIFSQGIMGNPLVLWGVLLEIILILFIDYTSLGNAIFGTMPIDGEVWLFIAPFALLLLLLEELRKWLARTLANSLARQKKQVPA